MKRTLLFASLALCVTDSFASHPPAQNCVEPPAGLVSWWPGDGDASDIESGLDGTLIGGAGFAPGFVGEAFNFNGSTSQRLDLPFQALDGLSDLTVELWVNTGDSNATIISGENASAGGEFIIIQGNGGAFLQVITNEVGWHTPLAINNGAWRHLAFTREGSMGSLYLDGMFRGSNTFPVGPLDLDPTGLMLAQEQDCLGGCFNSSQAFSGRMDEVTIYDRALSDGEIQAIFRAGRTGKCGKPPPPPTVEELLERIEALEDHTNTYRTGSGVGHNNIEAETGAAEVPED